MNSLISVSLYYLYALASYFLKSIFFLMSLYQLLHRKKAQQVSLNNTKVGEKLQNQLLTNLKPRQTKPTPPLLLLSSVNTEGNISSMPARLYTKEEKIKYAQENGKRPREPSHEKQFEKFEKFEKEEKAQHQPLKGRSKQLFKPFLRITDIQSPDDIRTLQTLQKAFKHVKQIAKHGQYHDVNQHLQSIRQDLHVQAIENHFTIEVLEYSLEYSLKNGDIVGFCKNIGQLKHVCKAMKLRMKPLYVSLHIMYLLMNSLFNEYQKIVETLEIQYLMNPAVRRAMMLFKLFVIGDYTKILRDYGHNKDLESHLMAQYRTKITTQALKNLKTSLQQSTVPFSKASASILNIPSTETSSYLSKL